MYRNLLVIDLRKTEKDRVGNEVIQSDTVTIDKMCIFGKIRRKNIEKVIILMSHDRSVECYGHRLAMSLDVGHYDLVSGCTASGDYVALVDGNGGMSLKITLSDDGRCQIVVILQGQIMYEPYTKCQQESKQKYCKFSPADIQ